MWKTAITLSQGGGAWERLTEGLENDQWFCAGNEAPLFPEVEVEKRQIDHWFINPWTNNEEYSNTERTFCLKQFPPLFISEPHLLWWWRVRRRRTLLLATSRPAGLQLQWETLLSARSSHCVIGAELRDDGVPSPGYFSPIIKPLSEEEETGASLAAEALAKWSPSCSSSTFPISPPLGRAVMQQPPRVGTNTLIVRHPAVIYCPVVTFIGGAANRSQKTETSLA